jgi:hypothetical protein
MLVAASLVSSKDRRVSHRLNIHYDTEPSHKLLHGDARSNGIAGLLQALQHQTHVIKFATGYSPNLIYLTALII